jgi:acetate---CoA ligase (ADP-forming)
VAVGVQAAQAGIARLLRARSVAIVGASPTPGALGASVLANLERMGFAGDIHLINPKRDEIGGRRCLKSIDALPLGVDAAVLAIPKAAVLETVKALAGRQCGGAVIFSAGFAEGGEAGMAEQRAIAAIAAEAGMVIEGPNCLGFVNHVDGVALTFVETPSIPLGDAPGVGIVSQSGAMAAVLGVMLTSRALGLSYSISTGNEAVTGVEDYLEYLIGDPRTKAVGMIVEQFRKPRRFLALAAQARAAGKPIVLLHPGRSRAARESAATHTGALAGDFALMVTRVRRAGVLVAESLEELGDLIELAARCPVLPAGGVAYITESGAFKALTLDLADQLGLSLPAIGNGDSPVLRAAIPEFVPVSNPLDITAQALVDPDLYRRALAALVDDARFGSIVLGIIQTDPTTCDLKFPHIIKAMAELKPVKPVIFAGLDEGAVVPAHYVRQLRALGVPYFPSPDRALRAIRRIGDSAPAPTASHADARQAGSADATAVVTPVEAGVIAEWRAKELLAPAGIAFPPGRFVHTSAEAGEAAGALGYPVVLKAQSRELSHKSDAGGVVLGLGDATALAAGWQQLHANIARHRPGLVLEGVLVEKMGARGVELIIGARNDPDWGAVVLAGFGGVQAEILKDVRLLTPDMGHGAILQELGRLKSAALLRGFRGSPALDVDAVATLIARLARWLAAHPEVREIDLNPVIVHPVGGGALALDALMQVGAQ